MMRREERVADSGVSLASRRCQDCGNQAKKDCQHLRCRTCCKSRGFVCETHVKSTWVPVSLRYPRHHTLMTKQQQIHSATAVHHQEDRQPNPKRYRAIYQLGPPSLGLQEGDFPVEACLPAAFRCVRVSSLDSTIDQYAYHTSVSIRGHVFTGILYDQGPELEGTGNYATGESSTSTGIGLLQQEKFVPSITATATGTSSTPYPLPFCPFTATAAQFFDQHPKS
ncbi:protein SHI RELATED SEQUENCE 1 [Dorcoceras hygrometricum]|uniref:Protein SHI RELATED SEQUENCE 1 n=1 Tax=Dorcoceras hygrometricum TaxID=472368 RepID=A0A2Z7CZI6_9LAMI|nr:protein SHI RELATED SEQUENCE 1 [Dorcoceras hygrometricum]